MAPLSTRPNFHKSVLFAALIFFLAVPAELSWGVNRWLSRNEPQILSQIGNTLGTAVVAKRIRFGLFEGVCLDDFVMKGLPGSYLPAPLEIEKVRMVPTLSLFPQISVAWRVVMENPKFTAQAGLQDALRMGRFFSGSPKIVRNLGPLSVAATLRSFEIRNGRVTLLSPSPQNPWRQEFESFSVFLGPHWFGGEDFDVTGHIAGKPEASFRVRGLLKGGAEGVTTKIRFDFQKFTTSYLNPHLAQYLQLPDEELTAAIRVKIRNGKLNAKGKVRVPQMNEGKSFLIRAIRLFSPSLSFSVEALMNDTSCQVQKLTLKTPLVEFKGGGDIRLADERVRFNLGLASNKIPLRDLAAVAPEFALDSGNLQFFLRFTGFGNHLSPALTMAFENCDLSYRYRPVHLSKLTGKLYLSRNRLHVDEMWTFVNDLPMRVKMDMVRGERTAMNFEFSTYPGQIPLLRMKNPFNLALRVRSVCSGNSCDLDAWLKNTTYGGKVPVEENWEAAVVGVEAESLANWTRELKLICRSLTVRHNGGTMPFRELSILGPQFSVAKKDGELLVDLREGTCYGGNVFFRLRLSRNQFAGSRWKLNFSLSNADLGPLLAPWVDKFPLTGRISIEGDARGQGSDIQTDAKFSISKGVLGPIGPLEKLADNTGLEFLRKFEFESLSGEASYENLVLDVRDLRFVSPNALMNANFKVLAGRRIAGTVSAKFPDEALKQSHDLRWLLDFVGGKGWIDFDFKMAGFLKAPRVQWLSGQFRRKIESKLAPWMRERLTQEIEKRLAAAPAASP